MKPTSFVLSLEHKSRALERIVAVLLDGHFIASLELVNNFWKPSVCRAK